EDIKIAVGSAFPQREEQTIEVRGRDLVSGLPRTVRMTSTEIREAMAEPIAGIVEAVKMTLERTPPELAADIVDRGIVMAGAGWLACAVEGVLAPFTAGLSRIGDKVGAARAMLTEIGTLHGENARLRIEVARLRAENAQLQEASKEALRLRSLLAFKQQPYHTISARVIGRDPSHWFSTVLRDRGAAAGLPRDE